MDFDQRRKNEIQKVRIKLILILMGSVGVMGLIGFSSKFFNEISGRFSP